VTVLRPLKGVDCNLVHNLVSSFQTRYPTFELIFCVASESDPAVEVVRDLICKYPEVDARLFVGDVQAGVNPKINNMLRGYEDAKYDIVWVLDSNVFVNPDCMGRSVAALLKPGIGLVHHLPCGVDPHTDGSRLEQAFLNTAHAKMYSTINKVGIASCLIGKSNMFRRSVLAKLGGLANFGKYMSEDNIMGEAIWALGLRHAMTVDVAFQTLGSLSSSDYFQRRARWIRIRKYTVTAATLFEPFTESIVNGLLGGWALSRLGYVDVGPFLAAHFIIWVLSDWIIATTLDPSTRRSKLQFWKAWFVREVSALPLWIMAMAGSTVEWRGKLFWLNSDGTV
ncbi:glycosyl transferase family 21-domain-containing protein, partial [Phlyctochytrium arcticum]